MRTKIADTIIKKMGISFEDAYFLSYQVLRDLFLTETCFILLILLVSVKLYVIKIRIYEI